jgi:hypothetical protein
LVRPDASFFRAVLGVVALTTEKVKSPGGLGVDGRRLWRQVVEDAAAQDLELTPIEQFWLHSAAKLTDQAAILEAELSGAPRMLPGSMGQLVCNPMVSELRQLHRAINLTLSRLKIEAPESSSGIVGGGSFHQRRGANIRWGRGG